MCLVENASALSIATLRQKWHRDTVFYMAFVEISRFVRVDFLRFFARHIAPFGLGFGCDHAVSRQKRFGR